MYKQGLVNDTSYDTYGYSGFHHAASYNDLNAIVYYLEELRFSPDVPSKT